jgi:hypothetical protein
VESCEIVFEKILNLLIGKKIILKRNFDFYGKKKKKEIIFKLLIYEQIKNYKLIDVKIKFN